MIFRLFAAFLFFSSLGLVQLPTPTPFATIPAGHWKASDVPWDDWFKENADATDKGDHVSYFWNAQDAKANFAGKDRNFRLADSALELATRLRPSSATSDLCKVDIVFVLERDPYGKPKWQTQQQVAHFEFSQAEALKALKGNIHWTEAVMKKVFTVVKIY